MPVADSAPILQNFTKVDAPMLRSMPPVTATSNSCSTKPPMDASNAAMADAQAASVTKFGPWKSNRLAMRPARMLPSSPGIVSSLMGGSQASMFACSSASTAARTPGSRAANDGAFSSSRASSGKVMRSAVR